MTGPTSILSSSITGAARVARRVDSGGLLRDALPGALVVAAWLAMWTLAFAAVA